MKEHPEKKLWKAVVAQAVRDLFYLPRNSNKKKAVEASQIRRTARNFLFSNAPFWAKHRKFIFEILGADLDIDKRQLRRKADEFESKHA